MNFWLTKKHGLDEISADVKQNYVVSWLVKLSAYQGGQPATAKPTHFVLQLGDGNFFIQRREGQYGT